MTSRRFTLDDLKPAQRAEVAAQLARVPHPKTIAVERVDEEVPKPKSLTSKRKETPDASEYFKVNGLPPPVREHRFLEARKFRFDYAWLSERIALEVEGGVWGGGRHNSPVGFLNDITKYNLAAVHGWIVLRCTPQQLRTPETVAMIKKAMEL